MTERAELRLIDIIPNLVQGISKTQVALDEQATRDMRLWHEFANHLPENHPARAIIEEVYVKPVRLSEFRVALDIHLSEAKQQALEANLNILTRPAHSFFHTRFGARETVTSQIEIVCTAASAGQSIDVDQETTVTPS